MYTDKEIDDVLRLVGYSKLTHAEAKVLGEGVCRYRRDADTSEKMLKNTEGNLEASTEILKCQRGMIKKFEPEMTQLRKRIAAAQDVEFEIVRLNVIINKIRSQVRLLEDIYAASRLLQQEDLSQVNFDGQLGGIGEGIIGTWNKTVNACHEAEGK